MHGSKSSLHLAALEYAAREYKIFPCKPGTKIPSTKKGYHDASSDPRQIEAWWRAHPNDNIGLPMQANGLVAVDPDLYKPECDWANFIAGKEIPPTWRQRSARGGEHIIFTAPPDKAFAKNPALGVDIISNGYIMADPSIFEGKRYQCISNLPPAPAPDWLLNAVQVHTSGEGQQGPPQTLEPIFDPVTGLCIENREHYLTSLIHAVYAEEPELGVDDLADEAWKRFEAGIDPAYPTKWTHAGARYKARLILRKKPPVKRRLIEGIEPEPAPVELSAAEAEAALKAVVEDALDRTGHGRESLDEALANGSVKWEEITVTACDDPLRRLIAGTAGLGKSRNVLDGLKISLPRLQWEQGDAFEPVYFLTQTIKLAEELADYYGDGAKVIVGRTFGPDAEPKRDTLCLRPNDVKEVTKAGIHNVASTLCRTRDEATGKMMFCPKFFECSYYRQFDEKAQIYFMSHEMLINPISYQLIPRLSLLVIDENPTATILHTGAGFDPKLLDGDVIGGLIVRELRDGQDPRIAARAAGWTKKSIIEHATELEPPPLALQWAKPEDVKAALKARKSSLVPFVLRKFAAEFDVAHEGLRCLTYFDDVKVTAADGSVSLAERLFLQYRKEMRLLRSDLSVLLLDGTADAGLLSPAFPGLTQETIPAARNVVVTMTHGFTASMKAVADDEHYHDEIAEILAGFVEDDKPALLVTYKDAEASVMSRLPPNWRSEHYGNLRGVDIHKGVAAVALVGRPQVPAQAMEQQARSLFWDDERPLTLTGSYIRVPGGIRLADTTQKYGVEAWRHVDPWVDRLRWQATEGEMLQAMDRARLVHRAEAVPVLLMAEVPLPVPVTHLTTYRGMTKRKGTRGGGAGPGKRLLEVFQELDGVIPLSGAWLARNYPKKWHSALAARQEIFAARKLPGMMPGVLHVGVLSHWEWRGPVSGKEIQVWAKSEKIARNFWKTFDG